MKYIGTDIYIRDVQKVELEILLEVDRICKLGDIKYQLFGGTLLGAIRHNGFIPWDDDIDICMLRKDYEKFLQCCKTDLSDKYFLQHSTTDKNSILQFAKVRKNGTLFINPVEQGSGMHNGIYIDIFPLDSIKLDTPVGKMQPWIFNALYIINSSRLRTKVLNAKNKFNRYGRTIFYYLTKIIPKKFLDKLSERVLRMYEQNDTNYVNHLTNGVSKMRLNRFIREKDKFYEIKYKKFEGHLFPVPKDYDDVLTRMYGDYMELPPAEDRYPHHGIFKVCFNTEKQINY